MSASFGRSLLAGLIVTLAACADSSAPGDSARVEYASLSAGFAHTCGLSTEGRLYCWGSVAFADDSVPVEVPLPGPIAGMSAANSIFGGSTCAWTNLGKVYCWGSWIPLTDVGGLYGNGEDPIEIAGAGPLTNLSNSTGHGCGLRSDSTAACWGGFVFGKRGLLQPDESTWSSLTASQIGSDLKFRLLATGVSSTCGIMLDRQVACWGDSGMLGGAPGPYLTSENPCFYQDLACRINPGAVPGVAGATAIANVGDRACAVGNFGVQCWGYGITGVQTVSLPVAPVDVGAGWDFACALATNGEVYCWGNLDFESETGGAVSPPTAFVVKNHVFTKLSVGRHHACGIIDDGSMYCWGRVTAALGDGKGVPASLPVRVGEPRG